MPAAALKPQKRILGESTKGNRNAIVTSPNSAKKRKLDSDSPVGNFRSSQNGLKSKLGSSQPKSQFETEVLEKLTQDISGLKQSNSEKDQQWERPSLDDFDEKRDSLCFQQIEAEEGTISGGKVTVKLFGVTEVRALELNHCKLADIAYARPATPCSYTSLISSIISTLRLLYPSPGPIATVSRPI